MGCSFITLREPCNNQRPACDIAWLHVTSHLYHGFPSYIVKQSHALIVQQFNSENRGINITYQKSQKEAYAISDKTYFIMNLFFSHFFFKFYVTFLYTIYTSPKSDINMYSD